VPSRIFWYAIPIEKNAERVVRGDDVANEEAAWNATGERSIMSTATTVRERLPD
jgi:hypothetical protein